MTLIRQPEGSSQCGQAVIAMLSGRTLGEVVAEMGTGRNYPAQIRKHASGFGIELARRSVPLVNGRGPEGRRGAVFMFHPSAHWAAWDGSKFLDPRGETYDTLPDDRKAGIYVEQTA